MDTMSTIVNTDTTNTNNNKENTMTDNARGERYSFEWDDELFEFDSEIVGKYLHLFFQRDWDGIDEILSEMIIDEEYGRLSELCDYLDIGGKQLFGRYIKNEEAKSLSGRAIPMIDAMIPQIDLSFL